MKNRFIVLLLLLGSYSYPLFAQCTEPLSNFFVPDHEGYIKTVEPTSTGDTVFIGGYFNALAKYTGHVCRIGKQSDAVAMDMPAVDGQVNQIISDGNGGWFVGGLFKKAGGMDRSNLARIDRNGQVHSFALNTNGEIRSLLLVGNKLFFSGSFTQVNGFARNYLAAADTSGTLLTWDAASNNVVYALGFKDGRLLVGGAFTSINGFGRSYLAQIDTGTALPTTWSANLNNLVTGLMIDDSLVYIYGSFASAGATARNRIAALRWSDASVYTPFAITQNGNISSMEIAGNALYFSGDFTTVNTTSRKYFAAVNKLTGTLINLSYNFDAGVYAVKAIGNDLYLGGWFTQVNNDPNKKFLLRIDPVSGSIRNWDPKVTAPVNCFFSSDTSVIMGGAFQGYHRIPRSRLAAIRMSTMELLSWSPPVSAGGVVYSLHHLDNKIIIGGEFDSVNASYRKNLCMVDLNGQLTPWDPSPNRAVYDISSTRGVVYLAGNFTIIGGLNRSKVAGVNADLGNVTAFSITPNDEVTFIRAYGNKLYLAGRFTYISGNYKNLFAAYDLSASAQNPSPLNNDPLAGLSMYNTARFLETGKGRVFMGYIDYSSSFNYSMRVLSVDTADLNYATKMAESQNADLGGLAVVDSTAIVSYKTGTYSRFTKSSFDGLTTIELAPSDEVTLLKKAGNKLLMYGNYGSPNGYETRRFSAISLSDKVQITASRSTERLCAGDSITFTSASASGNIWNDFSPAQTRTIKPLAALNYTVYVKAPVPGCSMAVSDFIRFRVNAVPVVTISSNKNSSICQGDSAVFSAQTSVLNTLLWSTGTSASSIPINQPGTYSVTATNEAGCKTTVSATQLYYPVPQKPAISPSGLIHICADSLLYLYSSQVNSIWLHGQFGPRTGTMVSGIFRAYYVDSVGCTSDTSDAVEVVVDTFPLTPLIMSSKGAFCGTGDSLTLSVNGIAGDSLRWSNGVTSSHIVIYDSSYYHVTSRNGTCSRMSGSIRFTDIKPLKPVITPGKMPAAICFSDSITLTSDYSGINAWSNGRQGRTIKVGNEGPFRVVAVLNGCASDSSDAVEITVNPLPPAPQLTLLGDSIISSAESNNSWYRNSLLVSTLNGRIITPTISGDYSVIVTNSFGCKSPRSNVISFTYTGLAELAAAGFRVYPNPVSGQLYIEPDNQFAGKAVQVSLTDLLGRSWQAEYTIENGMYAINTGHLPMGQYVLMLNTGEQRLYHRVLVKR